MSPVTPSSPTPRPQAAAAAPVLRCSDSADFLAALPLYTGFTVENSALIVHLIRNRVHSVLRANLPDAERAEAPQAFLQFVSEYVMRTRQKHSGKVNQFAVVLCTPLPLASASAHPHTRLARRIARQMTRDRAALIELCCVAPDGWIRSLTPDDAARIRPLREITRSTAAHTAHTAHPPPPSLAALGEVAPAPQHLRDQVLAELADCSRFVVLPPTLSSEAAQSRCTHPSMTHTRILSAATMPAFFPQLSEVLAALANGTVDPRLCAQLIRFAQHTGFWALLAEGIRSGQHLFDIRRDSRAFHPSDFVSVSCSGNVLGDSSHKTPRLTLAEFLTQIRANRDEHTTLVRVRTALRTALALTPEQLRAPLFALSAWVWWLQGGQTIAQVHAQQAISLAPEQNMYQCIAELVQRSVIEQFFTESA